MAEEDSDHEVRLVITWTPPPPRNGSFQTLFTFSGTQTPDYPPQRSNSTSPQTLILPQDQETYNIANGLPYAEYNITLQPFNVKTENRAPSSSTPLRTTPLGEYLERKFVE